MIVREPYFPPADGLVDRMARWVEKKRDLSFRERYERTTRRHGQTCWVWCPGCACDLVANPETTCADEELVHYTCGVCDHQSTWDFDSYPIPVRIS